MKHPLSILILSSLIISCQDMSSSVEKVNRMSYEEVEKDPNKEAYFGDLHIHTSWSFDAFIYNTRTTPDDAYMYGKGEPIPFSAGGTIQSSEALDFMAVTDHAEYMGIMKQMIDPDHEFFNLDIAKRVRDKDRAVSSRAFGEIGMSMSRSQPIEELMNYDIRKSTWNRIKEAADRHYEPGKFTTFPAYEFTSSPGDTLEGTGEITTFARNMHRNVIYQDKISTIPYSSLDSQNPEDLWDWMDKERASGIKLMAIPHNANMSDGMMYANSQFDGTPMTLEYIRQRMRNEPINEVVQIKGTSMSHPLLSKNDEFADFELYQWTFTLGKYVPSQAKGSYVREAFKDGLAINKELGDNPFKFGVIGSSDGHSSSGATEENNYYGKFGGARDGTPADRLQSDQNLIRNDQLSAAGLAGVWAESNTREDIFSALENKETYATSGSRIKVRFFGGVSKDFEINNAAWVTNAYNEGVPMGQDLNSLKEAPNFAIWAVKDANGANLDRIQVIKSWIDKNGIPSEKIVDVAWSGDRKPSSNGKITAVGNTVDVKNASYTNDIGDVQLSTVWTDPEFDPSQLALYYVRVLEIPTPRWSTYDAKKLGIEIPDNLDATIQERAWSSPIWYNP